MLVLLPGLICDASLFDRQRAAFADGMAIDGYPGFDRLEDMARHALGLAPGRFDLLGHSMGGRVALEMFRLAPERVARLALVSTGVHPVKEGEPENRAALQSVGYGHGFPALVDQWLPPMVGEPNRVPGTMEPLRAMCLKQGQAAFDAQIAALLHRRDATALLAEIGCPTLVMAGQLDEWSPPAQHEAMAARIAGASLIIVPDAEHMVPFEQPDAVNKAIAEWRARPAG